MKNKKIIISLFSLAFVTFSCSSDSSTSSTAKLVLKGKTTYNGAIGKSTSSVTISEFSINLREIEFKISDTQEDGPGHHHDGQDDNGDGYFGENEEVALSGPYELDLLGGSATIANLTIPNGTYEETEFKMDKSTNTASNLFNKSIQIKGTINGTPFVFWHDAREKFEIDYHDTTQNLVVADNPVTLTFDFDLDAVIASVDLSGATDGNGDGIIEISPTDTDGNNALANEIKMRLHESTELHED